MSHTAATFACLLLSLTGAVRLGASLYEISIVDPVWPSKPVLIQPGSGGIDRKRFWITANSLFELALLISFLVSWPISGVPQRLLVAAVPYVIMRGWSFAYFIPAAHHFERNTIDKRLFERAALRWTFLSRFRAVLDAAALTGCVAATAAVVGGG